MSSSLPSSKVVSSSVVHAAIVGLIFFIRRRKTRAAASQLPTQNSNHALGGQGDSAYQGEYGGDHKPYAALMSEAPGSDVIGREGYLQELNSQPQYYEMDARQRN
ncbi:hypothetical protein DL95DRAFT_469545 [Leptodontidium sp. 2 PMI_412]|nr:hypothetical protein DL95DRAFT_469545 [Leptodontidium sp. 2 PMI_412]